MVWACHAGHGPGTQSTDDTTLGPGVVVQGDRIVVTEDDVAAMAGIWGVDGDLIVEQTQLERLVLADLGWVGGDVRIWENPALNTLSLPSLAEVEGELSLYDNPDLSSLQGLSGLTAIGATLRINRMAGLEDLRGLDQLATVGGPYLFHDLALTSLEGLGGLRHIAGSAQLWELYALEHGQFPRLEAVDDKLDVFEAHALTQLEAPQLVSMRSFELHHCDAMSDLGSFPQVAELPGELRVQYNGTLITLAGFPRLTRVSMPTIRFNPGLQSTSDLVITTVIGELTVANHRRLAVLDLPALRDVRTLSILGNDVLSELAVDAVERLDAARIVGNPALPHCAVEVLLERTRPADVSCGGNLDDGCSDWCTVDAP